MAEKKPDIGKEVESLCTKCKIPTVHVIVAMKEDDIHKVMCKSCMGTHRYKAVEKGAATNGKAKKKGTRRRGQKKWTDLLTKVEVDNPRDYTIADTYETKDVIQHNTFGLGIVVKVLDANKMNVAFQEGIKTLVMNH